MIHKNKKNSSINIFFIKIAIKLLCLFVMLLLISYLPFSNTKNFNFTNTSTTIHMINMSDNNTIQISGHPFFPLGFYHDSYNLPFQKLIQAVRNIFFSGFNTIYASCNNLDNYGIFLDEAEQLGIYIITQFNIEDPLVVVKNLKDKPAILGWGIADDAGDHTSRDQILAFHKQIKAIDPKHYTYISISGWSRKWSEYADVADLVGGQSYPIGYPFNNKLRSFLISYPITFTLVNSVLVGLIPTLEVQIYKLF